MSFVNKKINVLISARDTAAAYSLLNLIKFLKKKKYYNIICIAMFPAYKILSRALKKGIALHELKKKKYLKTELMEISEKITKKVKPSFIITGLSGPGKGIDEALIYYSNKKKITSFSYQDFCGDVNLGYGILPDYYLVTDSYSSKITKKITKKKTLEVGFLNFTKKISIKKKIKEQKQKSILFCGQPLNHLPSYIKTLKFLFETLNKLDEKFILNYRPHPSENNFNISKIVNLAAKNSIDLKISNRNNINHDLIRSEFILTCYSSSIMDFSYLNFNSKIPIGSTLCLMYESGISQYYRNYTKLNFIPYEKMELTKTIYKKKFLEKELKNLFYKKYDYSQWTASRKIFLKTKKNLESFDLFIKNIIVK